MRRRLLSSTVLIVLLTVGILGVPLALLARNEVASAARQQLNQRAQIVGAGLEDTLDAGMPVRTDQITRLAAKERVVVRTRDGRTITSGAPIHGPTVRATVTVADATITVERSRDTVVTRTRTVTLFVAALGLLAVAAAVGLALRQASDLAGPLSDLARHADAFGRGEFGQPDRSSGIPEIDEISRVLRRSGRRIGGLIETQRDFAADAAHQLRTPLTAVALRLEEIVYLSTGPIRGEAHAALAQVERLDLVITALLARARDDAEPATRVDVAALVADECAVWGRLLADLGRRLVPDVGSGPTVAVVRRPHVASILTTLLDNALEHGTGTVTVSVRAQADDVVVSVRDEGRGIAPDQRAHVFDRAFSGGRGTGIGLALARALAEAEGARLDAVGDGNEFVLVLPGGPDTAATMASTATATTDEARSG